MAWSAGVTWGAGVTWESDGGTSLRWHDRESARGPSLRWGDVAPLGS